MKKSHLIPDLPILEKLKDPHAKTRMGINIAMPSVDTIFKHTQVLFHLKKDQEN